MSEIKSWFQEADHKIFNCGDYEFIINKGFKITHYFEDDDYTIQDTRHNDFYKSVSEADMEIIQTHGFLKGTSIIMHKRNQFRVEYYLERIRKLYVKKGTPQKSDETKAQYLKRIKNCNENIHNFNDLMHFYMAKVEQFNKRLKLN